MQKYAIFFGRFDKIIYFCPRIINIKKIFAYRNKLYSIQFLRSMSTLEMMSDEQLALAYIDGNNRAFDELLNRSKDNIFTYIMYMVKDEDLANDLFQETFLKVITKLQNRQYTNSGKFAWWLTRIAHNVIIDYYRAQKSSKIVEAPKENDLSNLRSSAVMDDYRESQMTNEQILQDAKRLMEALPENQREVVFMRYYQDLSFKEIAEITGVSINTSLGRMRYALMNMRKLSKQHKMILTAE